MNKPLLAPVHSVLRDQIQVPKPVQYVATDQMAGVILEGRKISIKFLRKLRLFDCISQKDLNKKTTLTRKKTVLL